MVEHLYINSTAILIVIVLISIFLISSSYRTGSILYTTDILQQYNDTDDTTGIDNKYIKYNGLVTSVPKHMLHSIVAKYKHALVAHANKTLRRTDAKISNTLKSKFQKVEEILKNYIYLHKGVHFDLQPYELEKYILAQKINSNSYGDCSGIYIRGSKCDEEVIGEKRLSEYTAYIGKIIWNLEQILLLNNSNNALNNSNNALIYNGNIDIPLQLDCIQELIDYQISIENFGNDTNNLSGNESECINNLFGNESECVNNLYNDPHNDMDSNFASNLTSNFASNSTSNLTSNFASNSTSNFASTDIGPTNHITANNFPGRVRRKFSAKKCSTILRNNLNNFLSDNAAQDWHDPFNVGDDGNQKAKNAKEAASLWKTESISRSSGTSHSRDNDFSESINREILKTTRPNNMLGFDIAKSNRVAHAPIKQKQSMSDKWDYIENKFLNSV